jgi:hypothetical protein
VPVHHRHQEEDKRATPTSPGLTSRDLRIPAPCDLCPGTVRIEPIVRKEEDAVDWRLYADRSRFREVPTERLFVVQGEIRRRDGKVWGEKWHVFIETSDFDAAWGRFRGRGSS